MSSSNGSILPPAERAFGKYELISRLATGGMAEIFLGSERVAGERELVVIKRVLPYLEEETRFLAMFRDEARLASQIIHPNVCRVLDWGTVGETDYIAMEYLHGVPLSRMLIRSARTKESLPIDLVVALIVDCARGLHFAHEFVNSDNQPLEVVHRDVSPPNILVTVEGLAKLLDFGVAKARGATQKTRTGTIKGKNSYMSPEQILGKEVDRRSDIFSLGIVLWEALSSKRLFSRETEFQTFTAITEAEIPNLQTLRPEVSDALHRVLLKALAKERDERFATADAFADELVEALAPMSLPSPSHIGSYIRESFSKELASKELMMSKVTQQMAAVRAPSAARAASQSSAFDSMTKNLKVPSRDPVPLTRGQETRAAKRETKATYAAIGMGLALVLLIGGLFWTRARNQRGGPAAPRVVFVYPDGGPAGEESAPAYLTVRSSEPATIYIDGKRLGLTPIERVELPAGTHDLRAVSDSGAEQSLELNLEANKTENLDQLMW